MRAANSSDRLLEHVAGAKASSASTSRSPVRQSSEARLSHHSGARRLSAARLATPKILLYSHDTFGLGNIRRTLLLAEELSGQYPGAAILMVTGSQMVHSFRIPDGVDYIKLPCLDRMDAERYEPRFLRSWSEEVKRARSAILEKSVLGFEPDLTRLYSESDIIVSMAGYNTVCELLSFGHHAILVPRAEPVQEQLIRARLPFTLSLPTIMG